ncbi:MAG: DNA cytosine methyltransferase [Ketobacter sp.]|nr:DNA cytosine methyltransferase [Ketobacter sp.]
MMKVLVGCEYTGIGREIFIRAGHDAISCDLDPTEIRRPKSHHQGDIMKHLESVSDGWYDLIILHPDCTAMALCGNGTYAPKGVMSDARKEAIEWTARLWELAKKKGKRVCLENPGSVIFPVLRRLGAKVQYVQPWWFGHPETKMTGLALHELDELEKTDDVHDHMMTLPKKERHKTWYASPSERRGKDRSRSFPGMLAAMADQWAINEVNNENL